jgi:hypothetical protein
MTASHHEGVSLALHPGVLGVVPSTQTRNETLHESKGGVGGYLLHLLICFTSELRQGLSEDSKRTKK